MVRKWGVPPSRTELTRSLKLVSGSAVAYHLQALERKGWIQLNPAGCPRPTIRPYP